MVFRKAAAVLAIGTILFGLVLSVLPWDLERQLGLPILFGLRGVRPAPSDVVIVAMNQHSARKLGLKSGYDRWPRRWHALLVERLHAAGAAVIAFDVAFRPNDQQDPLADDRHFADAIARAGNVILSAIISDEPPTTTTQQGPIPSAPQQHPTQPNPPTAFGRKIHFPIAPLNDVALGAAPFLLPPQAERIDMFWTFARSPRTLPTLPAIAVAAYARESHAQLLRTLATRADLHHSGTNSASPPIALTNQMSYLHERLKGDSEWPPQSIGVGQTSSSLLETGRSAPTVLRALARLYTESDYRFLNFIGPPGSLASIPFADVVDLTPNYDERVKARLETLVRGKIVFVGALENTIEDQKNSADAFATVFTDADRMRLQGVEIAATACANLLDGNDLHRAAPLLSCGIFVVCGIFTTLLWRTLRLRWACPAVLATLSVYGFASVKLFDVYALWLPVVVPGAQVIGSAFLALAVTRFELQKERSELIQRVSKALPTAIAREYIATGAVHWRGYGVCLQTDIESFTAVTTRLTTDDVSVLLDGYFGHLLDAVQALGGSAIDGSGDGMLAVWISQPDPLTLRHAACRGALRIAAAIDRFNSERADPLPTRIGLHYGELAIVTIGNNRQFRLCTAGSVPSIASRIEALSKCLGTRLLASDAACQGLENDFLWRPVGRFTLRGVPHPLAIHELMAETQSATAAQRDLQQRFSEALEAYANRDLHNAERLLLALVEDHPADRPSQFYLRRLAQNQWSFPISLAQESTQEPS